MRTKQKLFVVGGAFAAIGALASVVGAGMVGNVVAYDLSTDNYVGTKSATIEAPDLTLVNQDFTGMSISSSEGTITLERVYKGADELYAWRRDVENGTIQRRQVTVTAYDATSKVIGQLRLDDAWPSSWTVPALDISSAGAQTETIVFTARKQVAL